MRVHCRPRWSVTTSQAVPTAPTGVAARFGSDGTNILMWALSEDDGYNDRDVSRYDVFQAVLPGGSYVKVGEVPAGIGLYSGTNAVGASDPVRGVCSIGSSQQWFKLGTCTGHSSHGERG